MFSILWTAVAGHLGFVSFAVSVGIYWLYSYYRKAARSEAYPPYAPGSLPVVGHLWHFAKPLSAQDLFCQWNKVAGPIFTVKLGQKHWIVLNSMDAVKALIVDRSTIYSSRNLPDTLVNDLMDGIDNGGGFAFYPYGKQWRYLRRIAHAGLVQKRMDLYQPILDQRRDMLLSNIWRLIKKDPTQPVLLTPVIEHYTMTSILAIAYGDMCSFEPGDPRMHTAFHLTVRIAALLGPSEQAREFFPILKTILPTKRAKYVKVRQDMVDFYGGLLQEFKKRLAADENAVSDCLFKQVIANNELTDIQMISFAALFVGAGSETTASTIEWMIALLANHPEIQDRAYEEIIARVGENALPGYHDEPYLPLTQCIILETLRLRPPAPLSVPHATSQDDTFQNWFIPAGTTVVINLQAIHQDPETYPEPEKFIPERHMDALREGKDKQTFTQTTKDRPHLSFSTGRRVCVGIHLAERSLYMAAASLLSCFKFERETKELIDVVTPRDIRSPTLAPLPYRVRVKLRRDNVAEILSSL